MMDTIKPNKKYVYVRYCIDQLKLKYSIDQLKLMKSFYGLCCKNICIYKNSFINNNETIENQIRDEIIGLNTDHPSIWDYIEDAKSIIANRFGVNIENVVIFDYKYFGSELIFTDI